MNYFLFNHEGSCNHGCEAIVLGTQKIIEKYDKNCKIILSSHTPNSDKNFEKISVEAFQKRELNFFEKVIAKLNLTFKKSEYYSIKKMYSDVIKQAENADICLSVGGDTYCYGDNTEIQVLVKELKRNGKKVVLWGASIGREDLDEKKLNSLEDYDAIFAREPITYKLLKSSLKNQNIFLNFDPAFQMESEKIEPPKCFEKNKTIGINLSGLVAKQNGNLFEIFEQFISQLLKETDFKILLIPHVIENGNNDYEYMLPLYNKFKPTGRIAISADNLTAKQYKGCVANTRFFIGARTHATIAAYSSAVPTLVLGYSVKSIGISEYIFGSEKYVLNAKEIKNVEQLNSAFSELTEHEQEIKDTLSELIPIAKQSGEQLGELLMKQAVK